MLKERLGTEIKEKTALIDDKLKQAGEDIYLGAMPGILLMDSILARFDLNDVAIVASAAAVGGLIGSNADKDDRLTGFTKGSAVGTYVGLVGVVIKNASSILDI